MNILEHAFSREKIGLPLGVQPGVALLGHSFGLFIGTAGHLFKMVVSIYIPTGDIIEHRLLTTTRGLVFACSLEKIRITTVPTIQSRFKNQVRTYTKCPHDIALV